MNYIKHLTGFFDKLVQDDRLNPTHISLYLALFQFWNLQRFKNPISISREEVMRLSKIASKATYHKCMKELHQYQFINYDPSYNPYRGSLITLHNLELKHEHVQKSVRKHIKKQTSTEQVKSLVQEQVFEPVNEPSINSIKQIKTKETLSNVFSGDLKPPKAASEIIVQIKDKDLSIPSTLDEVKKYFLAKQSSEIEAEKFYNHFESNGWLVGGKTKMKNWEAAARNWILNSGKFQNSSSSLSSGNLSKNDHLHTIQNKDYSIPL
jgi:hypothetical protein